MKSIKLLVSLLLVANLSAAQTDCRPYVPTEKGATWEITNYNAKGKSQGSTSYELLDKVVSGNDVTFKISATSFDKKGKEVYKNEFEAVCEDGKFDLGMAFKMDGEALKNYENMDVSVDASKFEIPDMDAEPGSTLEDGELVVGVDTGAININMTILVTDRKVERREERTTPAGSFDCLVMSQTVKTKTILNVTATSKEWYAENIGMVRSETYNKRGKLIGYSELTKLSN